MDTIRKQVNKRAWLSSVLLLAGVLATAASLAAWKQASLASESEAASSQPEPVETVSAAIAELRQYQPTTSVIGTVLALRSITLRNELPGTVQSTALSPGQIVEAGAVLFALDVSVEQAELDALKAQAALAGSVLKRVQELRRQNAASQEELDRAHADRNIVLAQIARTKAIIERKIIRAPFRARVGLSDVHPGQYLTAGTSLTTLQGVSEDAHVDFAVGQRIATGLDAGQLVEIHANESTENVIVAEIVAIDARVDPASRNAKVRARVKGTQLAPGASVQVRVPAGDPIDAISIPASAVRKGPSGDHVFVVALDSNGHSRAYRRPVEIAAALGNEVMIARGIAAGEQVATTGSFKLREAALVARNGASSDTSTAAL